MDFLYTVRLTFLKRTFQTKNDTCVVGSLKMEIQKIKTFYLKKKNVSSTFLKYNDRIRNMGVFKLRLQ